MKICPNGHKHEKQTANFCYICGSKLLETAIPPEISIYNVTWDDFAGGDVKVTIYMPREIAEIERCVIDGIESLIDDYKINHLKYPPPN